MLDGSDASIPMVWRGIDNITPVHRSIAGRQSDHGSAACLALARLARTFGRPSEFR